MWKFRCKPISALMRRGLGQFERTIIIADEGSNVHYIEGCTAPQYTEAALHTGVIEIFVKKNAHARYTTIQNWSRNVYNLVTQRAVVDEDGLMEWVDGNLGSGVTMKYPAVILRGARAHGEVLSIAFAGDGQHYDAGAKAIHLAPDTLNHYFKVHQQGKWAFRIPGIGENFPRSGTRPVESGL